LLKILLFSILQNLIIISCGHFFIKNFITSKISNNKNYYEYAIFGIIFLSFLGVLINFFFPLDKFINNLVFIFFFIYLFFSKIINFKLIKSSAISGVICSILIILSSINTPDGGLYHMPYISILNENKIIIGLSNIHFRFAHTSIIQYICAIFENSIFKDNGILVVPALLVSNFIVFLLKKTFYFLNKEKNLFKLFFFILLTIFSLYSFSNYTNYGNDVPGHIYFFLSILYFLDSKNFSKEDFSKICILCTYAFLNKVFLIISLLLPIIILIRYKKINYLKSIKVYFSVLFIIIWLIKNILISGCLIYPIKELCYTKIFWLNEKEVVQENISGEAWSKGWSDQKGYIVDMYSYNKEFAWVNTWKKIHLKVILEKILPFVFLILAIILLKFLIIKKYNHKIKITTKENKKRIVAILFLSSLGLIAWFLKFPLYRYGVSYISIFIICLSIYVFNILSKNNLLFFNKNFYKKLIIFSFILFLLINFKRIILNYNKEYNEYPWPRIYSYSQTNNPIKTEAVIINNEIAFFKAQDVCMYSRSPCTHYDIEINYLKILGYKVFYKKNNF
jgi:hypothetical protein